MYFMFIFDSFMDLSFEDVTCIFITSAFQVLVSLVTGLIPFSNLVIIASFQFPIKLK